MEKTKENKMNENEARQNEKGVMDFFGKKYVYKFSIEFQDFLGFWDASAISYGISSSTFTFPYNFVIHHSLPRTLFRHWFWSLYFVHFEYLLLSILEKLRKNISIKKSVMSLVVFCQL